MRTLTIQKLWRLVAIMIIVFVNFRTSRGNERNNKLKSSEPFLLRPSCRAWSKTHINRRKYGETRKKLVFPGNFPFVCVLRNFVRKFPLHFADFQLHFLLIKERESNAISPTFPLRLFSLFFSAFPNPRLLPPTSTGSLN